MGLIDTGENDCGTCAEGCGEPDECPNSKRDCGHHCNHIWTQDACCWCDAHIDDNGNLTVATRPQIYRCHD